MDVKGLLRRRRIELGLTQEDVARYVGVSETTVARWESGNIANMKRSRILGLAEILQIPVTAIMGWGELETVSPGVFKTEPFPDPMQHILPPGKALNPKLTILFKRSRALTDKQLDLVNSIIEEMAKEQE